MNKADLINKVVKATKASKFTPGKALKEAVK
jgi:nucleoid DNA-binding protein